MAVGRTGFLVGLDAGVAGRVLGFACFRLTSGALAPGRAAGAVLVTGKLGMTGRSASCLVAGGMAGTSCGASGRMAGSGSNRVAMPTCWGALKIRIPAGAR